MSVNLWVNFQIRRWWDYQCSDNDDCMGEIGITIGYLTYITLSHNSMWCDLIHEQWSISDVWINIVAIVYRVY